uniref:Putative secreted protein n=1 Tax=Anopheles darlingi TaxID=43151 RepID=A0A2M4DNV8_ANODA
MSMTWCVHRVFRFLFFSTCFTLANTRCLTSGQSDTTCAWSSVGRKFPLAATRRGTIEDDLNGGSSGPITV